jgi:D-alanyl-D-alanine carboxypeptidase
MNSRILMRMRSVVVFFFALFWLSLGHAQDFSAKADRFVTDYVQQNKFIGTVLVARDGKPIFRKGYGLANREWSVPNGPESKFRLGSITKQFTATAILQLVEAGKLKLDDPISKYYTDSPAAWSKVTIHHLLCHTSGIPSYTGLPGFFLKESMFDRTPAEIVKLTQEKPLEFEPGEKFAYDNTGYVLLGYVIEKISGQKYADYLRDHIFSLLGMRDTGYDTAQEVIPHRASGYMFNGTTWVNAPYLAMSLPHAAGSLYSTVDDLLIWDQALYAQKPLTAASLDRMFTPNKDKYGYGWFINTRFNHKVLEHQGGINGFNTLISRYPDARVTVIVLSNMNTREIDSIGHGLAGFVLEKK